MASTTDLFVIILLEDEAPDFSDFVKMLHDTVMQTGRCFEILIIANGTEGFLRNNLPEVPDSGLRIRAISFPSRVSQAVCVRAGLKESQSDLIMTCGSYQQISAESIKELIESFDDRMDLIIPWRQKRVDPFFNQLQSRIFNLMVTSVTGNDFHDLSCTIRLQRRQVLEKVRIYGNMYRFVPLLAKQRGFRVQEIKCEHFQEMGKTGFYSFTEYMTRLLDIITLFFNMRYSRKPLRFFSLVGALFLVAGTSLSAWAFGQKLFLGIPIGNRPEVLMSVLMMVLGIQAAGVGLLAEIIAFVHGRQHKEYTIEKII